MVFSEFISSITKTAICLYSKNNTPISLYSPMNGYRIVKENTILSGIITCFQNMNCIH